MTNQFDDIFADIENDSVTGLSGFVKIFPPYPGMWKFAPVRSQQPSPPARNIGDLLSGTR